MTTPLPWNEHVAAVLREAEKSGWAAPADSYDPAAVSYDPVEKRITGSFQIPTLIAQEMLERGVAFIDSAGKFQLVDGEPLPPDRRTTHITTIVVRQVEP